MTSDQENNSVLKAQHEFSLDFSKSKFMEVDPVSTSLQTSIMPVVHRRGSEFQSIGSCFAVSRDGLLITARHVIDEVVTKGIATSDAENESVVEVLYSSNQRHRDRPDLYVGGMLPISHLWWHEVLDIGLMKATLPVDTATNQRVRMPALKLSPGIPVSGQSSLAFGYHNMSWRTSERMTASLQQSFSASTGTIRDIYFPQRDRNMLNFPCFRTTARYDPGMSGGPVFNEQGGVCGVVCSSVLGASDGDEHVSFASLIGPALLLELSCTSNDGQICPAFLYEFVDGGAVSSDDSYSQLKITRMGHTAEVAFGPGQRIRNSIRSS